VSFPKSNKMDWQSLIGPLMELTIEQALQQGVAAHKAGKLQDAERLYRAILQSQPLHPDANHNLGVLAVSVNKADAALPLFKTALEANPKIEQFWLSYIDALIKEKQFENARQVIEQAKKQGLVGEKFDALAEKLTQINRATECVAPNSKKSLSFSEKRKKLSEKKRKKQNFKSVSPPDGEVNNLLQQYQNKKYDEAEKLARSLTERFPKHQFAWKMLGAVLAQTGRQSEAIDVNQTAVKLAPQDAGAHNNLGSTLKELGRFEEAKASFTQAIALKPSLAEAHSNLGVTLKQLGRLDEAVAAYFQALTLKPDLIETTENLASALRDVRFKSSNQVLYPTLVNLLTRGSFARPSDVVDGIFSLLKHDPLIGELLADRSKIENIKGVISVIESLHNLPLLHHLMRVCPLPDLQLEELFVSMRRILIENLDEVKESPAIVHFLSTLSLHCFTNEYVYFESEKEIQLIGDLETEIAKTFADAAQPNLRQVLCLSSYRPLHRYNWCDKLEVLDQITEVKTRIVKQPLAERVIKSDIPILGTTSDEVSLSVRQQYEENPYPRWVKLFRPLKKRSIEQHCDKVRLKLHSENIKEVAAPEILIAGCGTGQHSVEQAVGYSDCQVTAVDLSLASLAYAQRQSSELGVDNLNYLQADILGLHRLDKEFDMIQSSGVLHHMADPMAGWKVLTDLLRSGGLMKIGLYSELARASIVKIRKEIASLAIGSSEREIRRFRHSLINSRDEDHQRLSSYKDFFSLSELRDLIFHVQEHRFTLPQIKNCLDELGLKFCGFESKDANSNFREFHGKEADIYDLTLWHRYEESNPQTFAGMYQFWCQKL